MTGSILVAHDGVVEVVESAKILVRIESSSACSTCHAKGVCGTMDSTFKLIEIRDMNRSYNVGDKVVVMVEQTTGFKALFLGYLLPFLIVMTTLIVGSILSSDEMVVGLLSLGVLIPYYLVLFFMRDRLSKSFSFRIKEN